MTLELPPEIARQLDNATFKDVHPAALMAVEAGTLTILDLLDVLPWFKTGADWTAWRAFLCAVYALPMTKQEFGIYQRYTGRKEPPDRPAREVFCPTGRRARKSAIAALIGIFEGGFRDYRKYTAPGEVAIIPIIGKNMEEAKQIAVYCKAILSDDNLRHLLDPRKLGRDGEPQEETISLINNVDLRIRPASLVAGRGKTIPLGLLDEVAFFQTEGKAPDQEVVRGLRPGQATIPDAKLFALSSPWAKRGMLYQATQNYYGAKNEAAARQDRVLVWWAPTLAMHDTPKLREEIAKEFRTDPISAESEYGSLDAPGASPAFREDVEAFVSEDIIDGCTEQGVTTRAPDLHNYFAFADVSGGSSDSFTLVIAHYDLETAKVVEDAVYEKQAPFDPDTIVGQAAGLLQQYGLATVKGDRYAGKWPTSRFKAHGITYRLSKRTKSQIYQAFLPLLNSGRCALLDIPRQKAQLLDLDRRVARGGYESIDHSQGGHDDVANALAGACVDADNWGPNLPAPVKKREEPKDLMEVFNRRIADATAAKRGGSREEEAVNVYRRSR